MGISREVETDEFKVNLFTPDMTVFPRDRPVGNRRCTNKKALSILKFIYMPMHIYVCLKKASRNTRSRILELLTPWHSHPGLRM